MIVAVWALIIISLNPFAPSNAQETLTVTGFATVQLCIEAVPEFLIEEDRYGLSVIEVKCKEMER